MKKLLAFTILTFALQACGDKTQRNENAESEKVEEVNTIENKKSISSDSERSRDTEFENEIGEPKILSKSKKLMCFQDENKLKPNREIPPSFFAE